jgi:hypothetical protein
MDHIEDRISRIEDKVDVLEHAFWKIAGTESKYKISSFSKYQQ